MATATNRVDELVKDYLLFRGLTTTLKTLELELKTDKEKGLRADKIVEQVQYYITNSDLHGLREYWSFLNQRLFQRLEQQFMSSVRKLEVGLQKLYIVAAFQNNRPDKVHEFFDKLVQVSDIQNQLEFKEWFAFPFMKNPEENTMFQMYFNKAWQDTLFLSLHNFLSVILQAMPAPTLLNFEYDHKRMKFLQEENNILKEKLRIVSESGNLDQNKKKEQDCNSANESLTLDFSALSDENSSSNIQEKQKSGRRLPFNLSSSILSKKKPDPQQQKVEPKVVRTKPSKIPPQTAPITTSKKLLSTSRQQSTGAVMSTSIPLNEVNVTTPRHKSQSEYQKQRKELLGTERKTSTIEKSQKVSDTESSSGSSTPKKSVPVSSEYSLRPDTASSGLDVGKSSPIDVTARQPSPAIPDGECPFLLMSQEEYAEHHSAISYCRFSNTGQFVSSLDVDGVVKIWTWSPQPSTITTVMARSAFLSLEWASKSDKYLLLGNRTGCIRLYDVKENKTLKEVVVDTGYPRINNITLNPAGVSFVCSAAAQRVHSPSSVTDTSSSIKPGKLLLWDVKTMKCEKQLVLDPGPVSINCSSYNHNGQLLITGAADGVIRLFDIPQGKCISQWEAHTGEVNSVQFSSDETACYSLGTDGKFIKWSIHNTGSKLEELPIHQGASLPFLATSPTGNKELPRGRLFNFDSEGQYILTCDKNKGVIYQLCGESGIRKTMELKGHKSLITTVDWSPSVNTRVALAGAMDGKIKVSTLLPQ
ncbi:hypothetical protein SNE40_008198 [Patella caerulea]|uniref:WD repeat-containing protein 91 n=1 Tax=Patella caerulea TaxID=87958 RepID=A0AAN8K7P8_PATCE